MRVADQKRLCPVEPGDIWRVGPHWFGCGDLADGTVLNRLMELAPPLTLVYSDPPWSEGDTKRYRTLSQRDGVPGTNPGWSPIFHAALTPAKENDLLMYVEMSRASCPRAMEAARMMGAEVHGPWDVHYRPDWTESLMFAADWREGGGPISTIKDPVARTAPEQALAGHEPGVVLDPCTGNGWTALAADRAGWVFVGHELTPRRLWTAMKRIGPGKTWVKHSSTTVPPEAPV